MSRIGKLPVTIPAGVTVNFENSVMTVKGPKGTLTQHVNAEVSVKVEGNEALVIIDGDEKTYGAEHGLYRALLHNMVVGVTEGYTKKLKVNGVGWKVSVSGKKLTMNIGFSHPIEFMCPEGVTIACPTANEIVVSGIDKTLVGQTAANIRKFRQPEPYHGYGIAYSDEVIERKEGKTGGKGKK